MKNLLLLLFALVTLTAHSQSDSLARQKHFNLHKNIAIKGYDPVAYFTVNKALKGTAAINYTHRGITYYFVSAENRDLFKKNPAQYEPQYGGWCAYAVGAMCEKHEADPENFKIVNGKLYLFYNKMHNSMLPLWNKDELNLNIKADSNWQKLSAK